MVTQIKLFITTENHSLMEREINNWLLEAHKQEWAIEDISLQESPSSKDSVASTIVIVRYDNSL